MTRICPKCSYIRKETDECPEWQCPSCQVAYIKAGDFPGSHRKNGSRNDRNGQLSENNSSNLGKWLIALIIVAGVSAQSYLSHKESKKQDAIALQNLTEARAAKASAQTKPQPVITLYGTGWCGYCVAARSFFKENGIAYTDLDVEKSKEDYNSYRKFGKNGIPVITIDNEVVEGFDEAEFRKKLDLWLNKA